MKINITQKEYRVLLELLHLSDWLIHAHDEELRPETLAYRQVEQKFMRHAKDFGAQDLVVYSNEHDEYFPTRKLEGNEGLREFIESYDEVTFWEGLVQRLADRDLLAQEGEDALAAMSPEELFEKSARIEDGYREEFERHGLERVRVGES